MWRRALRWGLLAAGAYLVVSAGLLAWSALDARQGLHELRALQREVGPADLLDGSAANRLSSAGDDFTAAGDRLGGPFLAPLRALPVVGAQVRAFAGVVDGSAEITDLAAEGVDEAQATVGDGVPTGAPRVAALRRLADVAERTAAELAAVDAGPGDLLVPPFRGAHDRFLTEKDDLEEALLRSRDAADALATVLDGPSAYLLFAANNAEMRSGSGMLLSVGLLVADHGELEVSELVPTEELVLDQGAGITDPDLARLWGFAGPDRDFRNLLLSPRFAPAAEQATRMWAALGNPPIDGVLTLDVVALEHLLGAVGPVTVDGQRIDAGNVRRVLLHDQYVGVEATDAGQAARRDRLGDVAGAVLERFDSSEADAGALAAGLRDAASGRHLMVWSTDPALQAAWQGVRIDGSLPPDGVLVSLLNRGNNKLDQYVEIEARLRPDTARTGTLRLVATNTIGPGEPRYIAGGDPDRPYGVYPGFVAASFPAGTRLAVAEGPEAVVAGADGGSETVAGELRLAPGRSATWVVRYQLPEGVDSLEIQPSARAPGVRWRVGDRSWTDERRPRVRIDLPA